MREKYGEGVIESRRYRERKDEGVKYKKGKRGKWQKEGKKIKIINRFGKITCDMISHHMVS